MEKMWRRGGSTESPKEDKFKEYKKDKNKKAKINCADNDCAFNRPYIKISPFERWVTTSEPKNSSQNGRNS
jgi:hypothetical protein